ncbi:hypothetical protein V2J09_021888, partial [Rumex salicifolius]
APNQSRPQDHPSTPISYLHSASSLSHSPRRTDSNTFNPMAFSITFSNPSFSSLSSSSSSSSCSSPLQITPTRTPFPPLRRHSLIKALSDSDSDSTNQNPAASKTEVATATATPKRPQKPVYSMKKGQIVRVDKDKYLNSVNYLSVDHPPFYKGLDYIYEDRGEVLDLRNFDTGEHALVAWVGIPTAPAWLPTEMLIKSDKLDYERM